MDALAREKMMAPGTAYRYTAPRTLAAMFVGAEKVVLAVVSTVVSAAPWVSAGLPGKISWGSRFRVQLLVGCDLEVGRLASPQLQTCRNAESHGKSRVFPEPLFRRNSTVSSLSIEDTSTSCGTPLTRTLDTTHILIDYTMRPSQILRVGGPKARPPRHSNPPHAYPKLTPSIETRPIPR